MWVGVFGTIAVIAASGSVWFLPNQQAAHVAVAMAGVLALLLGRGMFSIRSSLVQKTHWRSDDAREKRVALTFDDGPHQVWTPAVLDILKRHDVRATFFVVGANVRRHPEILRRMRDEGHEIACHGDTHSWTTPFRRRRTLDGEVRRCLDAISAAAGVTPRFYRPPIGIRTIAQRRVNADNDLVVVGMARRGCDTRRGMEPNAFARRFAAGARGGEVLALHDGEEPLHPSPRAATVAALPLVLKGLAARGLVCVPVSALISERPYRESPSVGWNGRSRGGRLGMAIFARTARLSATAGAAPSHRSSSRGTC